MCAGLHSSKIQPGPPDITKMHFGTLLCIFLMSLRNLGNTHKHWLSLQIDSQIILRTFETFVIPVTLEIQPLYY